MYKKIIIFLIFSFLFLNIHNNAQAIPVAPIKNLFLELIEKAPSFFDDLFKSGKKADDVINNNASKAWMK